ncbi:MAG TPA: CYTH and CHAD domain-containing protein [Actinomycetota bacterium]|nr:CYTH and CHAD domain-containing protein [Actinomycetota bacterium]
MTLEREIKLQVPPGFTVPELNVGGLVATVREPRDLVTTYLDTPDLRVARWGCSLRHRQGEGWTVKIPVGEDEEVLARAEHTFDGDDARKPPVAAADLLRAFVRGGELAPVARLRTRRRGVEVTDELGRAVAVVTDDEVSVMDGRRVASRFREVEVELDPAAPSDAAEGILARLREAGAGPVDNVPKLVRALGTRATEPPDVVAPSVDGRATVRDVVRRALALSVTRLVRHDAGVRLGEDPEQVHQARVATRRIRSDLRTFRDLVDLSWAASIREELRGLGGALGAVRDAEVLRDRLRGREPLLAPEDRPAVERLVAALDRDREAARKRLLTVMREPSYVALLDRLGEAATAPAVLPEAADAPAAAALGPALDAPWKHLRDAVEAMRADPSDEALHAARIRAKRVRYAAEAAAPVFGKRARTFAQAAAGLQDVLGEHQDAVVASAWLRAAAVGAPKGAFVAGQLLALEADAARAARDAWPAAWKALSRKKLRFWA